MTLIANRDAEFQTADVLLTATLRMRPDRIILGEVRGKEAMTFLEAINTGHGGSMTTLHAETPQLAVQRLAIAALKTEIPMTYADMIQYIENSIDVIIQPVAMTANAASPNSTSPAQLRLELPP